MELQKESDRLLKMMMTAGEAMKNGSGSAQATLDSLADLIEFSSSNRRAPYYPGPSVSSDLPFLKGMITLARRE
jgi:hypothetical protein